MCENSLISFLKDPHKEIKRIAEHLGVTYSTDLIDSIADAVSMENMKQSKGSGLAPPGNPSKITVYRKG